MGDSKEYASKAYVEVDFDPPPSYTLLFDGVHAQEELGRPFLFELDLSSGTLQSDVGDLLGRSGTLWLSQSKEGKDDRFFNGVVTRVVSTGLKDGAYRYRIELRPWIWLLSRVTDCLIFQNKSAFQIITQIFRDAGFSDFKDNRQAQAGDTELEYCVQYRETSLDFVTRLMELYGLYYYFEHEKGKHTLVISDDPNSHTELTDDIPFVYEQTEVRTVGDHIWEWHADQGLQSGKFTMQDYNFTTPSADLTSKALDSATYTHGDLEVYEYPGPYDKTDLGQKLANVRLQDLTKNRNVYSAASNARGLHTGWKFNLSNHPLDSMNKAYLITHSNFSISLAEGSSSTDDSGETVDTYRVEITAVPGDVHFRLERKTPKPLIRGPQTAVVVGPSGEEIYPDQYGRVKVKFHWDRADIQDEQRSCWIRVTQTSAGVGWGSMFIPRVGMEVIVEFLEGNPDRPLITGCVYNANVTVPYPLPDNMTRTTIKTNSSKGGGGSNELRFEDKKNEEEVFFHAQYDFNKTVLHNEVSTIKNDCTTEVQEGNHKHTVTKGNSDMTVSQGNRSVTVSQGNDTTTVSAGNHKLDVSAGTSAVSAAQSITLTVGANSIKIDTTSVTITVAGNSIKLDPTTLQISVTPGSFKMDPTGMTLQGLQVQAQGSAQLSLQAPIIQIN